MKVTVLAVGKIKEKFYTMAVEEYGKRLVKYCRLEIIEVGDEKAPGGGGEAEERLVKRREGERIWRHIREESYIIVLEVKGARLSSVEFSGKLKQLMLDGRSDITFIIGGSLGLDAGIVKRADLTLSFSDMTFPHQLMRVILMEQIYRAFRIMNNEPYHK